MKKHITGITALAIMITMSACAQQKKATTTAAPAAVQAQQNTLGAGNATTVPSSGVEPLSPRNETFSGNITSISMTRTPCFGRCPAYTVNMYPSGLVRYTSQVFTEYEGVYEKTADASKIKAIFGKFKTHRVDTCSKSYYVPISDVPGINYTIKYEKGEQQIFNAHFGPEYLKDLAKEIDAYAKVDKTWKKTGEVKKP